MDPSPEQRRRYAVEAARRRQALGYSQQTVADLMSERLGREIKRQSVTQWENPDQWGPRDIATLQAHDEVLQAGGDLVAVLLDGDLWEEVRSLRDEVRALTELVRQLDRSPDVPRVGGEAP